MALLVLPAANAGGVPGGREPTGKRWIDMNYGPFLTAALQVENGNIAYKGIAIRIDGSDGGVSGGRRFVVFDTDTLRYAAGWDGPSFIDWKSIVWDGSHQTHPSIVGKRLFRNPPGPGWARPGTESFVDDRIQGRDGVRYGPLDRAWAHWKGLYLAGERVVLSYTVGDTAILETPLMTVHDGRPGTVRSFDIGPRSEDLVLQVARAKDTRLELRDFEGARSPPARLAVFVPPGKAEEKAGDSGSNLLTLDGGSSLEVSGSQDFDFTEKDFTIWARVRTRSNGTIIAQAPQEGEWKPDGKVLFLRGGRLCYDIGWVGVVQSRRRVNDGEWHDVSATYDHENGVVRLYVDGEFESERELSPKSRAPEQVVRIGFATPNFPRPGPLEGEVADLRFYQRRVAAADIGGLAGVEKDASLVARWTSDSTRGDELRDRSGNDHHARRIAAGGGGPQGQAPTFTVAGVVGGPGGTRWSTTEAGDLRLRIPAGKEPARLALVLTRVAEAGELDAAAELIRRAPEPGALTPLLGGGPRRWKEEIVTKTSILGRDDGAFVVDVVTTPLENPYNSWMRLGGFDFFGDGRRAAVCTWMGDVWIVDGLGHDALDSFRWTRIASGLYQPLGLKVVDDVIHVLGRDQITRLHDLNGDGEADFYENFNNDAQVTEHFHEFAMDLQTDAEGNFYYCKGGRHALDSVVPQHGSLLKVSRDGSKTEFVAYGFRAPNGLCVNPDGSFINSDQEGHWTPANRINWIEPGGFYGYMWAYHRGERPETYDRPLCWIDPEMDNSPAEQLWVNTDRWGPLNGKLLSFSYGTGNTYLVLNEEVNGQRQGGVVKLPIAMSPTGIMRGRFHPGDGQLYACGLFGWSSRRTSPGGLFRVRYTGKPVRAPIDLHAVKSGVVLRFSDALDPRRAGRPSAYRITRWNYRWQERYGSDDFRVSDGRPGRETVKVRSARLAKDGRSVFLELEDMRPCMQMKIDFRLASADGARMAQAVYHTVHELGDPRKYLPEFDS